MHNYCSVCGGLTTNPTTCNICTQPKIATALTRYAGNVIDFIFADGAKLRIVTIIKKWPNCAFYSDREISDGHLSVALDYRRQILQR